MALNTVKGNFAAPPVARTFAASAVRVLHGADAPAGCKHLPAGIIVHNVGSLVFLDADGVTNTVVFAAGVAVGVFLPIAPAELTAANAVPVTVFWHRGTK